MASATEMKVHVHCFLMAPGQACSDLKLKDELSVFVVFTLSSQLYQHDLGCRNQLVGSLVLMSSELKRFLD